MRLDNRVELTIFAGQFARNLNTYIYRMFMYLSYKGILSKGLILTQYFETEVSKKELELPKNYILMFIYA